MICGRSAATKEGRRGKSAKNMNANTDKDEWDSMTYEEKNRQLYLRQKRLLASFLARGAITKAQYEKSLRDLTAKMIGARDPDGQ